MNASTAFSVPGTSVGLRPHAWPSNRRISGWKWWYPTAHRSVGETRLDVASADLPPPIALPHLDVGPHRCPSQCRTSARSSETAGSPSEPTAHTSVGDDRGDAVQDAVDLVGQLHLEPLGPVEVQDERVVAEAARGPADRPDVVRLRARRPRGARSGRCPGSAASNAVHLVPSQRSITTAVGASGSPDPADRPGLRAGDRGHAEERRRRVARVRAADDIPRRGARRASVMALRWGTARALRRPRSRRRRRRSPSRSRRWPRPRPTRSPGLVAGRCSRRDDARRRRHGSRRSKSGPGVPSRSGSRGPPLRAHIARPVPSRFRGRVRTRRRHHRRRPQRPRVRSVPCEGRPGRPGARAARRPRRRRGRPRSPGRATGSRARPTWCR